MTNPTDPFDGVEVFATWCATHRCMEQHCPPRATLHCIQTLSSVPVMRRAVVEWLRSEGNKIVEQMKKLPRESQGFIRLAFVAGVHTDLADQLERGGHDKG